MTTPQDKLKAELDRCERREIDARVEQVLHVAYYEPRNGTRDTVKELADLERDLSGMLEGNTFEEFEDELKELRTLRQAKTIMTAFKCAVEESISRSNSPCVDDLLNEMIKALDDEDTVKEIMFRLPEAIEEAIRECS